MVWSLLRSRRPSIRRRTLRPVLCHQSLEPRTMLSADGVGTFDPATGTWLVKDSATGGNFDRSFQFGSGIAVVGDWDGDGINGIGTFDPATNTWTLRQTASPGTADLVFTFGGDGNELPVVGDWDGDGTDGIGVFVPGTDSWSLRQTASAGTADLAFKFGTKGTEIPVVGDWNGDGVDGIGYFQPDPNNWALRQTASAGGAELKFKFGAKGNEVPLVGDWDGDGTDGVGFFQTSNQTWSLRQTPSAGAIDASFSLGTAGTVPVTGDFTLPEPPPPPTLGDGLLTLNLKPINLNLLGLEVASSDITVTVSANSGDGKLLGNLLETITTIVDTDQINAALNSVLGTTVDLLNSIGLEVAGVGDGVFSDAPESVTEVAHITVAPVHLDLLGAQVDTSPIELVIRAHAGPGLVLGNVLTALTDLFNPPLPENGIDLAFINSQLTQLLADLNAMIPGIPAATVPPPVLEEGEVLEVTVPAIDLNLLGLVLETSPITVNASAAEGDGLLLGNILTVVLNTLDATPEELSDLSANVNDLLAKVVGVLNASTLTLPPEAVGQLSETLQALALPDLVSAQPGASTEILDLVIHSSDGVTPPVQVDLLGVHIETSDIDATLSAVTGDGQVLGNLLYNVANLLNPGGSASLISLITDLAEGATSPTSPLPDPTSGSTLTVPKTLLTVNVPPIDLDLLGLEVQTNTITVTISAEQGDGNLLGNALTGLSTIINTQGVSDALNNVLASTVNLLNSVDLDVAGVLDGTFSSGEVSSTPILKLFVAPVHLDLLGVIVETSPIELTITAHAGEGLVLGNVVTALTDLFNPPLPETLDLDFINSRLEQLLADLNLQIPGILPAVVPPTTLADGQILNLTVPAIDLNLLGLLIETSPITVNATAETGDGLLLGNLLTTVLDTVNATPEQLTALNENLNNLLAKVVGVLNVSTLTLPDGTLGTLSSVLQTLALPTLITSETGATTPVLDLTIASTDGTTPPVIVDLLGVQVTTSDIDAQIAAQTGEGMILGNLVYNVSHLLDPSSPASLLFLLAQLAG